MVYCAISVVGMVQSMEKLVTPKSILYIASLAIAFSNIDLIKISNNFENITYYYIQKKYIEEAALIYCLGSACVFLGMDLIKNRSFPTVALSINASQRTTLFYVILIIGNRLALPFFWAYGSIERLLYYCSLLSIMFFAVIWIQDNDKVARNRALILYLTVTILNISLAFLRSDIILPTVIFLLAFVVANNDIKSLLSIRVLPFVILIIVFIGVFSKLGAERTTKSNTEIISEALSGNSKDDEFENNASPATEKKQQKGTAFQRIANLAQITQVVRLTEQNGLYQGRASAPLVLALIPRVFWPEKPFIEFGTWFALEAGIAYKADQFSRANNSVNMTIMGEFYLDFGWLGVVFGCLLMGGVIGMFWNATGFYDMKYNFTGTVFGGYLLAYMLIDIGPDLEILITFISIYLLIFFIKKLI